MSVATYDEHGKPMLNEDLKHLVDSTELQTHECLDTDEYQEAALFLLLLEAEGYSITKEQI